MASLQPYQSHGIQYFRIVESFRKNGKPAVRLLAHLGRVDDILRRYQEPDASTALSPRRAPCKSATDSRWASLC
jgi:hypothetical protein